MFSFLIYLFPSFNCSDTMGFSGQMNGWGLCAKYSLFVANFVIFVSLCDNQSIHQIPTFHFPILTSLLMLSSQIGGAILFGLGIWTLVDKSFVNELLGTNLFSGAVYTLIVTSAIVCLISFFGCLGAAKEVKCMLLTVSIWVLCVCGMFSAVWPPPKTANKRKRLIILPCISIIPW